MESKDAKGWANRLRIIRWLRSGLGRILLLAIVMLTAAVVGLPQSYPLSRDAVVDFFCDASGRCWALILGNIAKDRDRSSRWVRTVNNGDTWTSWQPSIPVSEFFFLDSERGWGLTGAVNPSLVSTRDGGVSWEKLSPIPSRVDSGEPRIEGIRFSDSDNGWMTGTESGGLSYVAHTSDGGKTLKIVPELCGLHESSSGLAIFPPPRIELTLYYRENAGWTWKQQLSPSNLSGGAYKLALAWVGDDGRGLALPVAGNPGILKTADFGKRWTLAFDPTGTMFLTSASFWDLDHGCAVGASTSLYCTSDRGLTWTIKNTLPGQIKESPLADILYSRIIFSTGGRRGWAVRAVGFLYQTDDGGNSWRPLDLLRASQESR